MYSKAAWSTAAWGIGCALVAAFLGAGAAFYFWATGQRGQPVSDISLPALLSMLPGGMIGAAVGYRKGFKYRLQAQAVLCQMQIEYNTRRD